MYGLLLFGLVVVAIWFGAHLAGLEYVDIWRCLTVALVGSLAGFLLNLLLFPLHWVPVINIFLSTGILVLSTAFAAKVVLSCAWGQAWTISGSAAAASLLLALLFGRF